MRVAVKAHDCHFRHVGESLADAGHPGAIDEPEIREGVGSQLIEEFGRRTGQRRRIWPELTCCKRRHQHDANGRQGKSASNSKDLSGAMHVEAFLLTPRLFAPATAATRPTSEARLPDPSFPARRSRRGSPGGCGPSRMKSRGRMQTSPL